MRYFLVFFIIMLFSCGRRETFSERLERFSEKGIVGVDFNHYHTFSILGNPVKAETLTVNNPHYEGIRDYVITDYYKGVVVKRYESPTFGKSVVFYCLVEDRKVKLEYVKIGDKLDRVRRTFGSPKVDSDSLLIYVTSAGSEINFYFEHGNLRKVEWKLYID